MSSQEHSARPMISQSDEIEALTRRIKAWKLADENSQSVKIKPSKSDSPPASYNGSPEGYRTELRAEAAPNFKPSERSLYRFVGYSTRKDERGKGRLVLALVSDETGELIPAFFNCNITYQRGPKKDDYFEVGRGGRFWLKPGSNFALFWLATFGKTEKWSRIYRQLNRLKPISLSGSIKKAATYDQVVNLKAVKSP